MHVPGGARPDLMAWPWSYRKTAPELHYLLTASPATLYGTTQMPVQEGIPQNAQGTTFFCPPDPWWLILGPQVFTGPDLEPIITNLGDYVRDPAKWAQGVVPDYFTLGFYSRAQFGLYTTAGCPEAVPITGSIGLWTISMDGEELQPQLMSANADGTFTPSLDYNFPDVEPGNSEWSARAITGDDVSDVSWFKRPASLGSLSAWGESDPPDPMDVMLFTPEEIGQMELRFVTPPWWIGPSRPWSFFEFTGLGHYVVKGWYIAYPSDQPQRQVSLIYPP